VNQGSKKPLEEFLSDMRKIKEFAVEITEDKRANGIPVTDIEL
jgi:hypothetical protein